ncbi:MAG TPA: signal peptidase I [Candidatus Agathobaculum merdavium]|nr:signal peptidase I [Candidatus Agathobaculum merdavium]
MQNAHNGEKKKVEGRFSSELFGWGESLMTVLIFFVVVFTFFVRLIGVDGSSMYPTLQDRNIMLVSNLFYTPEKGDIVVLNKQGFWNDQPIVKRVIATGGDTIDIDEVTGDVLVNGEVLDELYIAEKINTLEKMGDLTYPQTVPEGCLFVMGDNRNGSTDSRWSDLGMVDERYVLGHVLSVVFPFSSFGSVA